ncbi:MAG: efflux RND transporter periplasmic adaptor subunit [Anaerolineales bacterium]|jgi:HlyD family secretion protein|uniref:efflux RND transporter periplasmic adaptor subunit n=1 Tax=Candidatus Villigracilis vicinus TaxID=3140679 RepID=UPI00313589CA|nr:efflux RND transporter periplasmic adaptor subunit [Anaerolineales bacterium]MBK7448711.1 efflux RND transporter periplasmic adaptor subunit [Anaerolineales bacterium]MBK9782709.1 efflux RND transporter periplasmic adaptor subunit [Anaerolineales bacterium]
MRQFFSRFSRRTWIIIGVVAVILLFVGISFARPNEEVTFQTLLAERGDLAAYVGATGSVRAKQTATLTWQTNGIVGDVNAEIGERVEQGTIIANLDKATLSQNIILAEADLFSAQKALDELLQSNTALYEAEKAVDKAEESYQKAYNWRIELNGKIDIKEAYYDQFGNLKIKEYKGKASEETIADAERDLALAESKLEDARRAYERLLQGPDSDEVASARARVAAAEATLNLSKLIAPFNGTITQASSVIGDQVVPGKVGFRVDDLSSLLVDVQVSEVDINRVALGQTATLSFDAILGKVYNGEVVAVGQAGDTIQGVVSFTVTVELTDADEQVKPGMTAAVNVIVEEVKDTLLVPNRAVRLVDGDRVVYILRDGVPTPIKITLGASSDTMSVLASGDIKEGDEIILNPPAFNGGPFGGG